jgi:hypothetical protein
MRCRPGFVRIDFTGGKRERDQRRAGQCRCKMERRKAERLIEVADGAGQGRQRRFGLRDMHDALRQHEADAVALLGPAEDRIPKLPLSFRQPLRFTGAVVEEIGRRVGTDALAHLRHVRDHAIDGRVGKARGRHIGRIDHLPLTLPFGDDRLGERGVRDRQRASSRRHCPPAVETKAEAALFRRHLGAAVKALLADRRRQPARLLHRICRCFVHLSLLDHAGSAALRKPGPRFTR